MFEPAAGKVITNMRSLNDPQEEVVGFFYATEIDTIRTYVSPEMAGLPDTLCIPWPIPPEVPVDSPYICIDCRIEPRSTFVKPSYWPD